jgi:peptidoglycan hydrolase CwlO-like protein
MPFVLQAAAFQPQQQNTTANQSTAADSANKELEKKVDQLRGDVDELADATRRLTVVLGKIDEKLTSLESKVTALKTDNNLK